MLAQVLCRERRCAGLTMVVNPLAWPLHGGVASAAPIYNVVTSSGSEFSVQVQVTISPVQVVRPILDVTKLVIPGSVPAQLLERELGVSRCRWKVLCG